MILICYDGSQDARTAIERASGLFRGQPAVVLSAWEDFSNVLLRTGAALGGAPSERPVLVVPAGSGDKQ
jgi:hypothetical protein